MRTRKRGREKVRQGERAHLPPPALDDKLSHLALARVCAHHDVLDLGKSSFRRVGRERLDERVERAALVKGVEGDGFVHCEGW